MVERQIAVRGVSDRRVLEAMRGVPRHIFIGESMKARAYDDMALAIGDGQTISQPYMVARMTELLALDGNERVLEIGTGSGYQAAVLAELAHEVFTVERNGSLSARAKEVLNGLGYKNIRFRVGDGTLGWPEEAPFDRIIVTAATPALPQPLVEQLGEGAIIVAPVGDRLSQILVKGTMSGGTLSTESNTPCVFVPLLGDHGFKE